MSSGVILQLAAFGNQDVMLSGNPEISLFKTIYKRHTYFGSHDIIIPFTGDPSLGELHKIVINKSGDLLSDMYLNVNLSIDEENNNDYSLINNLGYNLIEYVELFIGQTKIDTLYGEFLQILRELDKNDFDKCYEHMIEATPNLKKINNGTTGITKNIELFIPLKFWFCKYSNVPLPLLALQHTEIYLNVKFREATQIINRGFINSNSVSNTLVPKLNSNTCNLITNQIWLHNDERKYFVSNELTYLIEQTNENRDNNIQYTGVETVNNLRLIFNHPVKAIFWTITQDKFTNNTNKMNYYSTTEDEQIYHFFLDLMLQAQNTPDTLVEGERYNLKINSGDGQLLLINIENKITKFSFGNKFNLSCKINDNYTISSALNIINNALKKIEILGKVAINLIDVNDLFYKTGEFTESEKIILGKIVNHNIENLSDTSNNNLFSTHLKFSNNTLNKSTSLKRYINHDYNMYALYPNSDINPTKSAKLIFNGLARTEELSGKYYNFVQPFKCKLNSPSVGINMYSFALKPLEYQPTGHCNFSKLDNVFLEIKQNKSVTNGKINIYALNYNVLKIKNGVSGLAFSS